MTKAEEKRILEELMASSGWALLESKMKDEIVNAAFAMAENARLTVDEMNFRRGAMWAARRVIELPTNMKTLIDNDLLMDAAIAVEAEANKQ
jgi:hypothetical protein